MVHWQETMKSREKIMFKMTWELNLDGSAKRWESKENMVKFQSWKKKSFLIFTFSCSLLEPSWAFFSFPGKCWVLGKLTNIIHSNIQIFHCFSNVQMSKLDSCLRLEKVKKHEIIQLKLTFFSQHWQMLDNHANDALPPTLHAIVTGHQNWALKPDFI